MFYRWEQFNAGYEKNNQSRFHIREYGQETIQYKLAALSFL
jgi:hypothetical protein